jgi:endonuclease/exonuclease/phosphatase (EEP) superfamily protein YafD
MAGAGRYWWIWLAVVPVAAWAIVRGLGLDGGSMLAVPMAFTPYVAIAALLVAGVALALGNWAATAVAALVTVCLAAAVLPRAIGDGTEAADGRETLTVLSANVHRGTAGPAALVAAVERLRPDVLSLQELTPRFAGRLRVAGLRRSMSEAVLTVDPKWPRIPGLGLYSRLPMRRIGPPSTRILSVAVRMPSGADVRVADVHPHTPKPGHLDSWRHSLEAMPSAGRAAPWVLAGDFNATLDQEQLRDVVDRGYRDAGAVAGQGLEPTWPQGRRLPPLVTIDHVLADRRLDIVSYAVEDQPGSDHREIVAVLALPWPRLSR